jgi:hypothetical protein
VKKLVLTLAVTGLLAGPLSAVAGANPIEYIKKNGIPQGSCEWQEALGIVNVRACEDEW